MKKRLLVTVSVCLSGFLAAQLNKTLTKIPDDVSNITAQKTMNRIGADFELGFMMQTAIDNPSKIVSNKVKKSATQSETVIGRTYYDYQTNSSVKDQIFLNLDGTISAAWTMEATDESTDYANRGTGYNYYDGSNWGTNPTSRIETIRTGWGNLACTKSGKEVVLSHVGNSSPVVLTRSNKGTGTWGQTNTIIPNLTAGGSMWPRVVASGDTIYAISLTQGNAYQGLSAAVVFHRSLDGGGSWDISNVVPTGLTSAEFLGFGGDSYAIAAKGNTVAIVAGDSDRDLVLTKSTDAGATWSPIIVMDCPIDKWDHTTTTSDYNNDGKIDTLETNDGSYAVALDNNGEAYVAFGRMRIMQTATLTSQGYSFFPSTDGLYLWRESYGANKPQLLVGMQDLYQKKKYHFPSVLVGSYPYGFFSCSLTSFPSLAIDDNNSVYLSYSSVVDSLLNENYNKLFRHQYIIKSSDGGVNWTEPYDVVGYELTFEGVYGSLAKRVDGNLHLIYQRDIHPGFGVNSTFDKENQGVSSEIVYVKIPVADLVVPIQNSIKENSNNVRGLGFYPNPASNNGTVEVVLNETAKVNLTIMNSVGQVVNTITVNGNLGLNKIDVDLSHLSAGMYFYSVKAGNEKAITKKLVIDK